MNYLSDQTLVIVNLLIQSGLQSAFLVCYYRSKHQIRDFLLLMAFFDLLLFPINLAFFQNELTLKNLMNMVLLFAGCRIIFPGQTWRSVAAGIILYELALVVTLFIEVGLVWIVFHRPVEDMFQSTAGLVLAYAYSDIGLAIVLGAVLKLFRRPLNRTIERNGYMMCLLLNLILCTLCWLTVSVPLYTANFSLDYLTIFIFLLLMNVLTFASFFRQMQKTSRQKAISQIRQTYCCQVEEYLITGQEEARLRQLRHDLLNFIESTSQPERKQKTARLLSQEHGYDDSGPELWENTL